MKIKYLLIAAIFSFQHTILWAQEIDQAKMDRDLKIAEDIVSSLIKNESNDGRFFAANPKATYIPGFGVIIDISAAGRFYSPGFGDSFNLNFNINDENFRIDIDEMVELEMQAEMLQKQAEEIERHSEIVARENERIAREHQRALEEKERELEREMERVEREREKERDRLDRERDRMEIKRREVDRYVTESQNSDDEYTYRYSYSKSDDDDRSSDKNYEREYDKEYERRGYQKDFEDLKPLYMGVITTFLADYADLIGQLQDHEQIMLVAKGGPQSYGQIHFLTPDEGGKFSGASSRKNVADFKAGRISRTAFEDRINFVESKGSEKKAADLELFSSIFQRLYKTDLATTYYTSTPISYERLKNFGVIYKMRLNSFTPMGRDNYRIATQKYSNLSRDERDRKVNELYPQFISELKQNIVDYGKTIKSLEADESILFQIRMNECNSCDIPREINVLVKNQTLLDLESGKINEGNAIQQIKVHDDGKS